MLTTVLALAFALTETPAREVVGPFVVLAMLAFYAFRVVQDVKRLHDLGYSGGWAVLVFVPAVNALYSLYLLFGDGQPYTNQFGPDPKGRGAEQDIAEIANTFR